MAWVVGLESPDVVEKLRALGYSVEQAPEELIARQGRGGDQGISVWTEADVSQLLQLPSVWKPVCGMDVGTPRDVFVIVEEYGERMPSVGYVDVEGSVLITPHGDVNLVDFDEPQLKVVSYMEVPSYEEEQAD